MGAQKGSYQNSDRISGISDPRNLCILIHCSIILFVGPISPNLKGSNSDFKAQSRVTSKLELDFKISDPRNSYSDTFFNFFSKISLARGKEEKSNLGPKLESDQKFDWIIQIGDQKTSISVLRLIFKFGSVFLILRDGISIREPKLRSNQNSSNFRNQWLIKPFPGILFIISAKLIGLARTEESWEEILI